MFENANDFIIDVKKDAILISIMLSMSIFGNFSDPFYSGPITFLKEFELEFLLDFKKKDMKEKLNNISYDDVQVQVSYPIDKKNTKITTIKAKDSF